MILYNIIVRKDGKAWAETIIITVQFIQAWDRPLRINLTGDVIEVSDLVGDGRDVKGFKKVKILEKWKHFLVAVATDSTPSGVHVRECYAYTDLATVMYTRPCIQF